jgi:hypothetical protein
VPRAQWLVASIVVMGFLVLVDVTLTLWALIWPPAQPPVAGKDKDFTGAESLEETQSVRAQVRAEGA